MSQVFLKNDFARGVRKALLPLGLASTLFTLCTFSLFLLLGAGGLSDVQYDKEKSFIQSMLD